MKPSAIMSKHCCHAPDCLTEIPPDKLFCDPHWEMVPLKLKRDLAELVNPRHLPLGSRGQSEKFLDALLDAVKRVKRVAAFWG